MRITRTFQGAAAMLAIVGSVSATAAGAVSAATPTCGQGCISVFSRELGSYAHPNYVEDILGGEATVGQPVGLKRASSSDPSEDILPIAGSVSDFYTAGMVSAEVNRQYGDLMAVQQVYAPFGVSSGLCVGLAIIAFQNEGLTLQPCSVPATTVWIVDPKLSPTTPGYFPIINGSTTDFSRPFAMDLPQDEVVSGQQSLQMQTRHLQFLTQEKTLPERQLWGAHFGLLN
jgi:hypothetical protein